MPFITIKITGKPLTQTEKVSLLNGLTDLSQQHLGKRREVTAAVLEEVPPTHWCIAGEPLPEATTSAYAEILITAGTNSDEEKAAMIRATTDRLAEILPGLATASYAVIRELPASDWGYGGLTQQARQQDQTPVL